MSIVFVAGLPGGGKSTFIEKNFKGRTVIHLDDFQKDLTVIDYDIIWKTYVDCCEALLKAIKGGKDVVLEHTLLKAKRRKYYVDAIREITDEPIDIYFVAIDKETYVKRIQKRDEERTLNTKYLESAENCAKRHLAAMELPQHEEGFRNITIITE